MAIPRILLVLAVLLLVVASPASAGHLIIDQPGFAETNLAEFRDFYVYGIFDGTVERPGDIRIELFRGDTARGTPVRVIQSHVDPVTGSTNESVMDASYPNGTRRNGAMVPDLIRAPGGIRDPGNKVVVTNRYYLGLIQGGVTKDFDTSYQGPNGLPLADLTAGNYTIAVTGISGACTGERVNKTVTLGLTSTALGRFSPQENMDTIVRYAAATDRHVYLDWFPGFFTDPDNSSVRFESPQRWTPNNGIEVVNDRPGTHADIPAVANNALLIYNINSGSTTCSVEMAAILRYHLEDCLNTTFLHYDTGEPLFTYRDAASGRIRNLTGIPVPFPRTSQIVPVRAEILMPGNDSRENFFDPHDIATPRTIESHPEEGILAPPGSRMVIYGAARPIASSVTPTATPYRFTVDNRIGSVRSVITDNRGRVIADSRHEMNLSRSYPTGSPNRVFSQFEFGIALPVPNTMGHYQISLAGYDMNGQPVSDATAMIPLTVSVSPRVSLPHCIVLPEGGLLLAGRSSGITRWLVIHATS
ncbi:MAG: hypothetical protein GYA23_00955 [Methanomicrobiales archaeon]|nr:hypothetical protein [Methanomicrobiales archaeon]